MRLVMISDTHGNHDELDIPEGDVLIHAGDFTEAGTIEEVMQFNYFLSVLPHAYKIVIAGNHDFCMQRIPDLSQPKLYNATYLFDSSVVIDGLKFYGSPWQPWFFDFAFNLERGEQIKQKWDKIEADSDILITHGPPAGIRDTLITGDSVGCEELLCRIQEIKPTVHVFGHIHEAYGFEKRDETVFINACSCDRYNLAVNKPIGYDI